MGLPDDVTSVYLRQLNARGLLGVDRAEIKVFYNTSMERSLPESEELHRALKAYVTGPLTSGWEEGLVRIFKGFTHFNRLAMIIRLARGEATLSELTAATGTVVKSQYHHLRFLYAAGLIDTRTRCHQETLYRLLPQQHPVAQVLLRHVLDGVKDGETYYNPAVYRIDDESKVVLDKITREEKTTAWNWEERRGTGVGKRRLSNPAQKALTEVA